MRPFRLLVVGVLLLSACIPNRDNPNDPTLAPKPALTWNAGPYNRATATCGVPDEIKPPVESRGRCLHLDASGSTLHDDSPATRFRYSLVFEGNVVEQTAILSSASYDFTPDVLAKYGNGIGERVFRVEVSDSANHASSAEIFLAFTNDPPIVRTPGPRIIPQDGLYWTESRVDHAPLGSAMNIRLTARESSDPDRDRLAYCWELLSATSSQLCDVTANPLDTTLPPGWSLVESTSEVLQPSSTSILSANFSLTISDGLERERGYLSLHSAAALPLWARDQATHDALRMDVRRDGADAPPLLYRNVLPVMNNGYGLTNSVVWYVQTTNGSPSQLRHGYLASPDYYGPGSDTLGPIPAALAGINGLRLDNGYDPVLMGFRNNLWVTGVNASGNVEICLLAAFDFAPRAPCLDTGRPLSNAGDRPILEVGSDGTLWYLTDFGPWAFTVHFDSNGGTLVSEIDDVAPAKGLVADPGYFFTGLAERKLAGSVEHSEYWLIESRDIFNNHDETQVAKARIFDDTFALLRETPLEFGPIGKAPPFAPSDLIGFPLVSQPRFTAAGSFGGQDVMWVNAVGVGLATAEILPFSDDMRLRTMNTDIGIALDTILQTTGELILIGDGRHRLYHGSLDGGVSQVDTESEIDLLTPASSLTSGDDAYWALEDLHGPTPRFALSHGSGKDGVLVRQTVSAGLSDGASDYLTGDLWFPTLLPSQMKRLYPDGQLADSVLGTIDAAGTTQPFSGIGLVAVDPETGAVWVGDGISPSGNKVANRILRFDPYAVRSDLDYAVADFGSTAFVTTTALQAAVQPVAESGTSNGHPLLVLRKQSAPDATCPGALTGGAASFALTRIHTDGTVEPGVCVQSQVPANPNNGRPDEPLMSRDLFDGSACVVFRPVGGGNPTLRHYRANLSAYDEVTIPFNEYRSVSAVLDTCWLGIHDYGSNMNGVYLARFDQADIYLEGNNPPPSTLTLLDPNIHGIGWIVPITEPRPVSGAVYNAAQQEMLVGGDDGRIARIGFTTDYSSGVTYAAGLTVLNELELPFQTSLLQP